MTTRSASPECLPKWSTPRSNRPSWGPHVGKIAAALGKPLMPWQQHVIDVALEIDPDTGKLVYRDVRLTVPRQSGKTTLLLPKFIWRSEASRHLGGRQRMLYAAQAGQDARRKWREDYLPDLDACKAMRGKYRVRLANGSEAVVFRDGSIFGPTATTEKAGHGLTLDDGTLDEAFSQLDDRVDQAWNPAMVTREQAQFWIVSTVGTAKSVYLRRKNDEGRAAVEGGLTDGIAYFEWSADPDADPHDPATWYSCMPALGYTQSEAAIRSQMQSLDLPEFRRAFLNQWTDRVQESVIPLTSWANCRDADSRRDGPAVLCLDVSPDRSTAAVAMAGVRSDRLPHVQVIRHLPGTGWVVDHLVKMYSTGQVNYVVVDRGGPAGALIQPLLNADVPVKVMGTNDLVQACGSLFDAVVTEQLRHTGQDDLDAAVAGADRRTLGDAWAWKRRTSTTDISPLVAVTGALWGLGNDATEPPADITKSML